MGYVTAFIISILFALGCVVAYFAAWIGLICGKTRYAGNIVKAQDKVIAALFGYDGTKTLSKECGQAVERGTKCFFCKLLCNVLHYALERGHCKKEAK